MSTIENLIAAYERHVGIPWDDRLAGPQKVWFAIYEPNQERRLRRRIQVFQARTEEQGYKWRYCDLTGAFAEWMSRHEYREAYFEDPEYFDSATLQEFSDTIVERVVNLLQADDVDERTVVALGGVASLFGLASLARIVENSAHAIRGRLLVFFPGQREGTTYRLLNAPGSWNYLAVPIEP